MNRRKVHIIYAAYIIYMVNIMIHIIAYNEPIQGSLYSWKTCHGHWSKANDSNCYYGHPKMVDVESGKNRFCRLNCFYNVF